jgi:hypothetical protein
METPTVEPRDAVALCARLFETDLGARSDLQLADDLRELHQVRNLLDGEVLRRLAVFDGRGAAVAEHVLSTQAWLRGVLHLSPTAASGHVAVARRMRDGGPLATATACGDLSYEHAVVIDRAVAAVPSRLRAEAEQILADTARFVHPSDLRIAADRIREAVAPETLVADQEAAHDRRFLNMSRTLDGMLAIDGMLDPVAGAHYEAAMHGYATPFGPDDTRTATQRRADALTEVIAAGLAAATLPETGGERPHVALTLDVTALLPRGQGSPHGAGAQPVPTLVAHLSDRATLVGHALDALLCDMSLHRIVTLGPSEVLDIGRRSRLWPSAIRRAAALLYDGCAAYRCDRPAAYTDLHHVMHWVDGGPTTLDNGIPLCRAHQTLVHKGGWVCERRGRLWTAVPPSHALAHPPPDTTAA